MIDKILRAVIFTGLASVLIFSPLARGAVKVWSVTPVLLMVYALLFLWLAKRINKNTERGTLRGGIVAAPIVLFAILATTSFAFSIYKYDSFYALIRLCAYIGLYYMVANEFDHTMRRCIIWVVIAVGGGISAYSLLQYFGIFDHSWWIPKQFLAATYTNHNHFAGYLELVIPVAVVALTAKSMQRATFFRAVIAAALVLMCAVFILTQSRGAWVSLGCALLIMIMAMIWNNKSYGRIMIILTLGVAAAVSLVYFTGDMMSSRLATITAADPDEDVSGGRFKIWQGAMGMIQEKPITGVGIGDFDHGFYRYRPLGFNARAVYAHNDYLHMAAEMGVFAPFIMVWLFIIVIRDGFRKRESSPYAFGCAIGIMSLALHGTVDFNFHIPANMILFTVWMAIITSE